MADDYGYANPDCADLEDRRSRPNEQQPVDTPPVPTPPAITLPVDIPVPAPAPPAEHDTTDDTI